MGEEDEELEKVMEEIEKICSEATPDNCPEELCGDECEEMEEDLDDESELEEDE